MFSKRNKEIFLFLFSKEVAMHWHSCPKTWECPLGVFQSHGDVALRDMVSGHGGVG